jgi:hypothetical protein
MALLIAGMLIGPVSGSTVAYADTTAVSTETETIVSQAFDDWNGHLGTRQRCSSGVTVVFQELSSRRGEYRTGSGEVVIDPTDSAAGLDAIVVHELSHHTFLACGAFADADFTAAFYAAQGIPADRDWFDYSAGWSQAPAEHFAEVMATVIVGSGEGGISVGAEAIALISRWLAGAAAVPPVVDEREPVPYSTGGASAESVAVSERGAELPTSTQLPAEPPAESSVAEIAAEISNIVPQIAHVSHRYSWRAI